MKNFTFLLSVMVLLPFIMDGQEQNSPISDIAERLQQNLREDPKEKFLIQTDKDIYDQGETIWFTVFIVDSVHGKFTRQSKNLFVDLLNSNDTVVKRLLLRGDQLFANGSIDLKDSLLHGLFWIRAYTRKTLDQNINNVSIYPVFILNGRFPDDGASFRFKEKKYFPAGKPVIELYPEGGSLISGANSMVALKAHDANGQPLMVSGIVRDLRRDTIASFSTNKMGLAKFEFSPVHRRKYIIFIANGNNLDSVASMTASNMYAAQVAVLDRTSDNIHVRVLLEDSLFARDYESYLICANNDSICFAGIGRGNYELNIPTRDFPSGKAHIFLYNQKQQLLSERSVYVKKNSNIAVITDKQNYAARENVKMDITITDNSGKPVVAVLSVSIADSKIADSANHFFRDDLSSLSVQDLELLMLTSESTFDKLDLNAGLKRTSSRKYLNDTLLVTGRLMDKKHEPGRQKQVSLISKGISSFVMQDTTNANGKFSFMVPDFSDSSEFHLQVDNLRGVKEEYAIELDPYQFPEFTTPASLKEQFYAELSKKPKEIQRYVSTMQGTDARWLKPVTIKSNIPSDKTKIYSGYIITKEMIDGSYGSVTNAILRSGRFHELNGLLVTGGPNKLQFDTQEEPIIVVDGTEVHLSGGVDGFGQSPVISYLSGLDAEGIEYIKLLNESESGMYGIRGARGVIEIYSSHSIALRGNITGLASLHLQGYHVAKPFVMPDYDNKKVKNSRTADERLLIFWDGNVVTDNNGKATVSFFTADLPAIYVVKIEGVTAKGDKIFKTFTINRK